MFGRSMIALINNMSETWQWRLSGDSHFRMRHAGPPHRELIDVSREQPLYRAVENQPDISRERASNRPRCVAALLHDELCDDVCRSVAC